MLDPNPQKWAGSPGYRYLLVGSSAGVAHTIDFDANSEELMNAAAPGTHATVLKVPAHLIQEGHRVLVHRVQLCHPHRPLPPTQREHFHRSIQRSGLGYTDRDTLQDPNTYYLFKGTVSRNKSGSFLKNGMLFYLRTADGF